MVDKNVVTPLHVQVTNELRKEILAKGPLCAVRCLLTP